MRRTIRLDELPVPTPPEPVDPNAWLRSLRGAPSPDVRPRDQHGRFEAPDADADAELDARREHERLIELRAIVREGHHR